MAKYFIVWNENKTEGYITDSEDDADTASSGSHASMAVSTAAEAFYNAYTDDGDEEHDFITEQVELP